MSLNQFDVLIEIPKDSKIKYEYDKERNLIRLDRFLFGTHRYPGNYGFIPKTLELDGDPLDVLILSNHALLPGSLATVRIIGGLDILDENEIDRKLLAVIINDPEYLHFKSLKDLDHHKKAVITDFFAHYKDLENKTVKIKGWISLKDSLNLINDCFKRYKN